MIGFGLAIRSALVIYLVSACLLPAAAQNIADMNNRTIATFREGPLSDALTASAIALDAARKKERSIWPSQ